MESQFLGSNPEAAEYNQYWYSAHTIQRIVADITEQPQRVAFLSTPSLYFSVPAEFRKQCSLFEFDKKWSSDSGFVLYDFNAPSNIPSHLIGAFDMAVIDAPFITRDVLEKYAESAHKLLKPREQGPRILITTVYENAAMVQELLGVSPQVFQPSIPHLVYQYSLYTNYSSAVFALENTELA